MVKKPTIKSVRAEAIATINTYLQSDAFDNLHQDLNLNKDLIRTRLLDVIMTVFKNEHTTPQDWQASPVSEAILTTGYGDNPTEVAGLLTAVMGYIDYLASLGTIKHGDQLINALQKQITNDLQSLVADAQDDAPLSPYPYDIENSRYEYINLNSGKTSHLTLRILVPVEELIRQFGTKPSKLLPAHEKYMQDHSTYAMATEFASSAGVLIPGLAERQNEYKWLLNGFEDYLQERIKKDKLRIGITPQNALSCVITLIDDMFVQKGRLFRTWTKTALKEVLDDPDNIWRDMGFESFSQVYFVLHIFFDYLNFNSKLSALKPLQDGLVDFTTKFANENGYSDATDSEANRLSRVDRAAVELFQKIEPLITIPRTKAVDPWDVLYQNAVVAIMMADNWTLDMLINIDSNQLDFDSQDEYNDYCVSWFKRFVKPGLSPATAARLTHVPMTMNQGDFWSEVFIKLVTDQKPANRELRFRIALQKQLNTTTAPTLKQIAGFIEDFEPVLKALGLTPTEFHHLVNPESPQKSGTRGKVISFEAAKRRKRK